MKELQINEMTMINGGNWLAYGALCAIGVLTAATGAGVAIALIGCALTINDAIQAG